MDKRLIYLQRFKTEAERFWEKVNKTDGCWLWTAAVNSKGRGNFYGRSAPRKAWELTKGQVPRELNVCHTCDNPRCVNPHHLFLGTQKDNVHDMLRKGRRGDISGERHGRSKLNWESVKQIRSMAASGRSRAEIKARFSIGDSQISRVVRGEQWQ